MPVYKVTIKVEGDVSKTEMLRIVRVMTKALRKDTQEHNAKLKMTRKEK